MTDSNRPRHSLEDDSFDEAFAFDDESTYDGDSDHDRAATGAGAGGATAASGHGGASNGLPLRGLAMILLAVAIVLIGWGAFSMFSGGDEDSKESTNASQSASENAGQNGAQNGAGAPGEQSTQQSPADQKPSEAPEKKPEENGAGVGNENNAQPPAGGAEVNRAEQQVTVLNNSPIQGLAGDTAERLRGQEWGRTSFGNLPDTAGAFPKSVVLYPGNDAAARAAAEQIAGDLGIAAEARTPEMDKALGEADMLEGEGPGAVVVVTTNDMPR